MACRLNDTKPERNQYRCAVNWTIENKRYQFSYEKSVENAVCKMAAILSRSPCVPRPVENRWGRSQCCMALWHIKDLVFPHCLPFVWGIPDYISSVATFKRSMSQNAMNQKFGISLLWLIIVWNLHVQTRADLPLMRPAWGPCLSTATWRCGKNFSQWECSFHWKLRCHWLEFLRQRQFAVVRQGPWICFVNWKDAVIIILSLIYFHHQKQNGCLVILGYGIIHLPLVCWSILANLF